MSNSGSYLSGTGAAAIEKITGNAGGAVGPSSGNINLVGSGSISVTGTPGTSTLTITNSGVIPASFPCDTGTATPALGSLTMAGGTNLNTVGAGATVTVNLDSALTAIASMDMAAAGRIGTGLVAGNTSLLQAYNAGTASYVTFATLTAHAVTPTMDLADNVTKAGQYIYRAGGTDIPVTDGGTGLSLVPGVSQLLVGNGAGYDLRTATAGNGIAITYAPGLITTSLTNGTNGQLLIGGGAGAAWATPTSTGGTVAITGGVNTLNFETSSSVLTRFDSDAGIATPALGIVSLLGGDNIHTSASGNAVTIDLDSSLVAIDAITTNTAGSLRTGITAGNTTLLRAYNNTSSTYTTFATLTANLAPTMDLADGVTKAGQYIYRAAGTDVAVADGGTGISTVPTDGTLLIGSTGVGYVSASLSAGSNITITPGAGSISIAAATQIMTWSPKTAAWNIAVNNGYLVSGGTQWVGTLPVSAAQGSLFRVAATGALGFKIAQNAGQSIVFGNLTTTIGVGGSIASTALGDSIEIICTVADTTFLVLSSVGSFNIV